jgi:lysophospholipase L1-like esterase
VGSAHAGAVLAIRGLVRRVLLGVALAVAAFVVLLVIEAVVARVTVPDDGYVAPPAGPREFGDAEATPLSFVVLGDSTGAGRGADYDAGIAVGAARALAEGGRRVTLVNLAVSGATLADVRAEQLDAAMRAGPDLVLVSAGANDVTGLRRTGSIRADLEAITDGLREERPGVPIVVTGSPDVGSAPRFAQPLRAIAGWRAGQVNEMVEEVVRGRDLVLAPIAERTGPVFRRDRSLFAEDGYHPSAAGYDVWMPVLREALASALGPAR